MPRAKDFQESNDSDYIEKQVTLIIGIFSSRRTQENNLCKSQTPSQHEESYDTEWAWGRARTTFAKPKSCTCSIFEPSSKIKQRSLAQAFDSYSSSGNSGKDNSKIADARETHI